MARRAVCLAAASALVLVGCGGGGGGDSPAPSATPLTALRCGVTPTLAALTGSPLAINSSTNASIKTPVWDSTAIVAGACLLASFQSGGPNQFGGRPANGTSEAPASEAISCGIYAPDPNSPNIGATLLTQPTANMVAYCTVVYSGTVSTSSTAQQSHYFKITQSGTTAAPVFTAVGFQSQFSSSNGQTQQFRPIQDPQPTVTLNFTKTGNLVTSYTLTGDLPPTIDASGTVLNPNGRTTLSLSGNIGADTTKTVAGFAGSAVLKDGENGTLDTLTFRNGTLLEITYTSTGVGTQSLYGWTPPAPQ